MNQNDRRSLLDNIDLKVVGILSIVALEITALLQGIDGTILATGMALIGGIVGYEIRAWKGNPQP